MQLMIKTAESRYAYNKEKLNTIYKTKASLFELNTMEIMLSSEIEQKRITLNTLMNRDKNTLFKIDTNYQLKSFEVAALDTGKLASHLSEVKSIDQSIQLAKLRQNVENSKRLPDFGIKYDHMNTFGTQANLYSLMGMITVPIAPWSSKMYSSNAAALNHEINSLQRKKESVLNETSGMLQGLRSELAGKKQQVLLYETKIIPAFQNNYQTSILSYQQNTEELFMVLDALQTLKMAQITYLDKVGELLKLQVEFEKLLEEIE
jgi:outer membrane protein TolC